MSGPLNVTVELGARSYPIWIGPGLLDDAPRWRATLRGRHVLVVSNDVVAPLYLERVVAGLEGLSFSTLILPDGEAHKTLDSAARVFAALAERKASRDATIVALGGGVIGDLSGFAAACWMRGIAFVQMPTTLLAMVDSSVGGKTAVDLPQGKNLVGAFHQPRAVVVDTSTLTTLPERELRAGLAEVVKCGALGGGVIGDLSGFAAACWMRGIAFVQMPTTLLAMVDSSVGGKTAVDLPQGKNLVGAFHQPRAVVVDTSTLTTLPERELRAGLAEVVKYGALGDAAFFAWLEQHADALLARDAEVLAEAIAACCRQKAGIVSRDETEQGERALLNFGHTFGHALETATGYGMLLHGEAIAIGMLQAARLSTRLQRASAADAERLQALLARCGLPTSLPPETDPQRLLDLMRLDKKNVSGRLRLILWRGLGQAEIAPDVDAAAILSVLEEELRAEG